MLYTLYLEDNQGRIHEVQEFGIDVISEDSVALDLSGVKSVFPGVPKEVYNRLDGAIDRLCLLKLTTVWLSRFVHCGETSTGAQHVRM